MLAFLPNAQIFCEKEEERQQKKEQKVERDGKDERKKNRNCIGETSSSPKIGTNK